MSNIVKLSRYQRRIRIQIKKRRIGKMKEKILNEIKEEIRRKGKWYHIIIIDIFPDLFYYTYRKGMVDYFNDSNK